MDSYEVVFDAVFEDFKVSMFGQYSNSVSSKLFEQNLMEEGWKYFEIYNLNELFHYKYTEAKEKGLIGEIEITET